MCRSEKFQIWLSHKVKLKFRVIVKGKETAWHWWNIWNHDYNWEMVIKLFHLKSCCSQFVVLTMAFFSLSFIDFKISIIFYLSVSYYFSLNLIDRFISLPCVLVCYSVCLSSLFSLPLLLQLYRPLTLHLQLFLFFLPL